MEFMENDFLNEILENENKIKSLESERLGNINVIAGECFNFIEYLEKRIKENNFYQNVKIINIDENGYITFTCSNIDRNGYMFASSLFD